jgi:hypothetical protein
MPQVIVDKRCKDDTPQPEKFPGINAVAAKIGIGQNLKKVHRPDEQDELNRKPEDGKYAF